MSSKTYPTDGTQQSQNHPTSPWTETFRACMSDAAQMQPAQAANRQAAEPETQEPTHEALSYIYNREG